MELYAGALLSGAFGPPATDLGAACATAGTPCTNFASDLGLEGRFFPYNATIKPWLGYGLGITQASYMLPATLGVPGPQRVVLQGLQWLRLSAGVDFSVGRQFQLGPFIGWNFGEYSQVRNPGRVTFERVASTSAHQWWRLGFQVHARF
jgi:hypothetical protein